MTITPTIVRGPAHRVSAKQRNSRHFPLHSFADPGLLHAARLSLR